MPSLPMHFDGQQAPEPDQVPEAKARFENELVAMIAQLRNVPSIIGWVPFNEGWGEFDTARIAALVKDLDPTRLVVASSGVNCCFPQKDSGAGDVYDDHTYVGPGVPLISGERAIVDGEYGGLGLVLDEHRWPGPPDVYEMCPDSETLTARYAEFSEALVEIIGETGLSGAIYTQLTDVENEVNGFYTYDRRVLKLDPSVADLNRKAIFTGQPFRRSSW